MQWDLEEQRMRARFCELRETDRRAGVPGFDEVCRGGARTLRWGVMAAAAVLVVMIGCGAALLMHGQGGKQVAAEWPDIEFVVPEEMPMEDSPTAPLLTYVDDASGTWPGDRGFN